MVFVSFCVCFFSCIKKKGSRGFGGNLIIIDEAAFIKRVLFYSVILPVVMVEGCGLICISSPEGDDNWFSRLIDAKDEAGNPLVFSSMFSAVCEKCRNKSPTEMVKCKKIRNVMPKHKDKKKMIKYGKALSKEGFDDINLRENYGQITRSSNCAFRIEDLEYAFKTTVKYNGTDIPNGFIKQIICAIDPNGGGKNRTAIWFGYLNTRTGNTVVSHFLDKEQHIKRGDT